MWNTFKDFVKGLFNSRIAIVVIVYLLFFAILGNRLFMLQIVDGEKYASEGEKSTRKRRRLRSVVQEEIYTIAIIICLLTTNYHIT